MPSTATGLKCEKEIRLGVAFGLEPGSDCSILIASPWLKTLPSPLITEKRIEWILECT